jgi:phosphatidylinositol alpha-1,6-mannosyltransferase
VVLHGAEVTIPSRIPLVASSLRYVLRRATVAICAGPFPEREARRNAAETLCPVIQIPPGADTFRFRPLNLEDRRVVRESLGRSDDEFLIASWSRLVPRKGFDTLIRASAQLRDEFPQLRVILGGEGRDRARLERLAQKLSAPVTFLGYVDDARQPQWIAACDLMVMDCRNRWLGLEQEGFGIVFIEGAACALAQVAGRSGGSHDAVRDKETGLIVDNPRSVSDLARAIASLVRDDDERARLARRALEVARFDFTWDQLASQLSRQLEPFDRDRRPAHLA